MSKVDHKIRAEWKQRKKCVNCGKERDDPIRLRCFKCQVTSAEHPQVMTELGFLCDEKLVTIITLLNKNGYVTHNSCQDNVRDFAWVEFAPSKYKKFKKLMNGYDKGHEYKDSTHSWRFPRDHIDEMGIRLGILLGKSK